MTLLNKPGLDSDVSAKKDDDHTGLLLLTMADTTWRIFVPIVLFVGIGIWADVNLGLKPWLTFLGLAIGALVAVALVRMQINKIKE